MIAHTRIVTQSPRPARYQRNYLHTTPTFLSRHFEKQSTLRKAKLRKIASLEKRVRILLSFFIVCLVISGGTAFFIETGLSWLVSALDGSKDMVSDWLKLAYHAAKDVNDRYPFMAYGYDWLAFSHLVIAVAFIGPLREPAKNIWIIQFGLIACCMVLPLAIIAGHFRQIPPFWRGLDCLFGLFGAIPLGVCYYQIKLLEKYCGTGHVV